MKILVMPDGSSFRAADITGVSWSKAREGQYGSPARVTLHCYRSSSSWGGGGTEVAQLHSCDMESDEAAKGACEELSKFWTGVEPAALSA